MKIRWTQLIFKLWLNNFFRIVCFVVGIFSHLDLFDLDTPENFILISNCVHFKVFPLMQFLFLFAYFHWIQMQSIPNYLSSSFALRSLYLFRYMCNFAWTKWILHGSALEICIVERLESFYQLDNFLIGKNRDFESFFWRNAFIQQFVKVHAFLEMEKRAEPLSSALSPLSKNAWERSTTKICFEILLKFFDRLKVGSAPRWHHYCNNR